MARADGIGQFLNWHWQTTDVFISTHIPSARPAGWANHSALHAAPATARSRGEQHDALAEAPARPRSQRPVAKAAAQSVTPFVAAHFTDKSCYQSKFLQI